KKLQLLVNPVWRYGQLRILIRRPISSEIQGQWGKKTYCIGVARFIMIPTGCAETQENKGFARRRAQRC
ncbi:MAG: hypothetical protein ACR2QW_16570, partial [bacterium]